MAQPRYKSEVFVPIHKDDHSFEERQKSLWEDRHGGASLWDSRRPTGGGMFEDMHERMEKRRRDWEQEVERMRHDFFKLKPTELRRDSSENILESKGLDHIFYDDAQTGDKRFRVSFDVSQFRPEEINVRTQDQKLIVHAKHEETGDGRSESREFSRQVDIPKHVDSEKLTCTLSKDGILQVEAPVPAPEYQKIRAATTHQEPPVPQAYRKGAVLTEQDGSRSLKMTVDIGTDFRPEDIVVKTVDKKLIVYAKHEEKAAGRTSVREFNREFELPENVDANTVTASMSDEGKLTIEAPLGSYSHGSYEAKPGSTKQPRVTISLR